MKILIVYKEDYPWDIRVEKIAGTLQRRGHRVTILASNYARTPTRVELKDLSVRRLPRLPRILSYFTLPWNAPHFANPVWSLALTRCLKAGGFDVIVVRDIPLVLPVLALSRVFDCRVVLDIAECYSEMYRALAELSDHPVMHRAIKNPALADLQEFLGVRFADLTLTVVEENRNRLIDLGHDPKRIVVVSNTPRDVPSLVPSSHEPETVLRLIHIGIVERIRGIDHLLDDLAMVRRTQGGVRVELDLIGAGPALPEITELVQELSLGDRVRIHGKLGWGVSRKLLTRAHVGIIPHVMCEAWNRTVSNKLFNYMAHGLPVLSTDTTPTRRIIEASDCGLVYRDFPSFARAVEQLDDPAVRTRLGGNGRRTVEKTYNWGRDGARLVEVIESLHLGARMGEREAALRP